jgi:site-specific recombinase XerD
MRKAELRQQLDKYCQMHRTGSHQARKHRRAVLHQVVRDLFQIKSVPAKWHALTHEQIQLLVQHWQKKKLKPSTIMKYMTVIRNFLQHIKHQIGDIDNQSLGVIHNTSRKKTIKLPENILQQLSNPIAKILFELQASFGLTLSEAMRLSPSIHIRENKLWITREVTRNSYDKVVPLNDDKQKEIIQSFLKLCSQGACLIESYGYHQVCSVYSFELKKLKLPSSKTYRYLYAKKRHADLSTVLSPYKVKQTIMDEMGLQSRRTLWNYLNKH